MATGAKMSYNFYQNGKYGPPLPQNPGKDMEITQDMHLKMSKKIAQLTKVIYALNTKNDEHEAIVANIKEQHEDQMQQLLSETKAKIETFRQRLGTELEQQKRLEKLEMMVEDQERHKRAALTEFEAFRKERDEQEVELKTAHSKTLLAMSQEVLGVKKEFQARLEMLDTLKGQIEKEKETALENQRLQHGKEIMQLKESLCSSSAFSAEQEKQHEHYKLEIEKLSKLCEALTAEKQQICDEYDGKLHKAQMFYEKELQAITDSQNASVGDELQRLREQQQKMVKDFGFEKSDLTKRIDGLINQVCEREEEVESYKKKLELHESNIQSKDSSVSTLQKQLSEARDEAKHAKDELKEVQAELRLAHQQSDQQAKELVKISAQLSEIGAIKEVQEKELQELRGQLSTARDRIRVLENAKRALESQSSEQTKQQVDEIQMLEKEVRELSSEKEKMIAKYEQDLKEFQSAADQKERQLLADHQRALNDLKQEHVEEQETLEKKLEEKLRKVKEELAAQLDTEMSKLLHQKEALEHNSEQTRAGLLDRLSHAESEVSRLTTAIEESSKSLGSATAELNSLKVRSERLKQQLDASQCDLRTAQNKADTVQGEFNKLKELHETKMREAEVSAKKKLDQLSHDLDTKWTHTLRKECEKVTAKVMVEKEEVKREALAQLAKVKDAEIDSLRYSLTQKIGELQKQLTAAQVSLDEQRKYQVSELDQLKREAEDENRRLMKEMLAAAEEYASKIETMEGVYSNKLKTFTEQKEREAKVTEEELKTRHIEDMQAQMIAHKATLESVQQRSDERRKEELQQQQNKHIEELDKMRSDLRELHSSEMESTVHDHQQQLAAARMELERSIDLARQKESEYGMKVSDLEDNIRYREQTINTMEEQVRELQLGVKQMVHELETRGKEVLRIRSETNKTLMLREEQLETEHQQSLTSLSEDYLRDKQVMLLEFSEAQDLLKDKISALQLMLEEAEERYQNRESRPEDLEVIAQLQNTIRQREQMLHKLTEDKRKFQMELMNRETNFNKVFNSNPQVGLLNPLATKTKGQKKSEKVAAKILGSNGSLNSLGSGSTRLDPLPNSPLHDGRLNQARPLPPMKKFVR